MKVNLSTDGRLITADLKIPKTWLASAILSIITGASALGYHMLGTYLDFQDVKRALSECLVREENLKKRIERIEGDIYRMPGRQGTKSSSGPPMEP